MDDAHIQTDAPGLSIDLGAVGKGVAADEVCKYLNQQNADSTSGIHVQGAVVSIGGTVLVYGKKSGNQVWQVGIRNPRGSQDSSIGYLSLKETTVVSTSGDYEQYFEEDGVRYHHIFDPSTGYPADSGLMSVTVVCEQGIYSDGLSTACFILGYEDSLPLLKQYDAEAVFITTDYDVIVTDGLTDSFTLTNDDFDLR
jgi:thiamine biosynthesis lipoprotein